MLHNLRYYWRRAEKLGGVAVESARAENLDELFEALLRLHGARWRSRGLAGVLADGAVQEWHREALPGLLVADCCACTRLLAWTAGSPPSSTAFAGTPPGDRRACYYILGFDP